MAKQIKLIKVSEIGCQAKALRGYRQEFMKELKESISKEGILTPVVVSETSGKYPYVVIDGLARVLAATDLGLETILAVVL